MKLRKVKVTNFKSIINSTEVDIGSTTCLVGKNQSGKTAFLLALAGFNSQDANLNYEFKRDYPRTMLHKYLFQSTKHNEPVVTTTWELEDVDMSVLVREFGENYVCPLQLNLTKTYNSEQHYGNIPVDHRMLLSHIYESYCLTAEEIKVLNNPKSISSAFRRLSNLKQPTWAHNNVLAHLGEYPLHSPSKWAIEALSTRIPTFVYFSNYDQMSGKVSIEKLLADKKNNLVSPGDKIFLDLLNFVNLNVDSLERCSEDDLNSICEVASNNITDKIFKFWTQNKHLEFQLKISQGLPTDPEPFNSGMVASARIFDKNTRCSLQFSEQSSGFIWFFSFLVKFSQLKGRGGGFIILLDEPGLTIHGTAQQDLLRYFKEVIEPRHQLIYTTHSPFMVPANDLSIVRTVQNIELTDPDDSVQLGGTKVRFNFHSADDRSNLPILSAMGYSLTQGLLVKPNMLLVEGLSDSIYLEIFSRKLALLSRESLDVSWAICPTGGIDKIGSFITLFCRSDLNIVVLCDHDESHPGKVERLRRRVTENSLINDNRILYTTEFLDRKAADIEDFFEPKVYIELVNATYDLKGTQALKVEDFVDPENDYFRIVKKIEPYFKELNKSFEHPKPARYLMSNSGFLDSDDEVIMGSVNRFEALFRKISEFK